MARRKTKSRESRAESAAQQAREYLSGSAPLTYDDLIVKRSTMIRKPPKQTGKMRRRTVVVSDVHFPKQDPVAWALTLQAIRDLKPDSLWILGDFIDFASINGHEKAPGDERITLKAEVEAANVGLDELDEAATAACDRLFVSGNHDEFRLQRFIASGRCPGVLVDSLPPFEEMLFLRKRGYRYVKREEQPFRCGDLLLVHGKWFSRFHAAKHLDALGDNVILGHTHRPQVYTAFRLGRTLQATALPCLRQLSAEWEHLPKLIDWASGFAVIEWDGTTSHPYLVLIRNGTASYGDFRWQAK